MRSSLRVSRMCRMMCKEAVAMTWYDFCVCCGIGVICNAIYKIMWVRHLEEENCGRDKSSKVYKIIAIIFAIPGFIPLFVDNIVYEFFCKYVIRMHIDSCVSYAIKEHDEAFETLRKIDLEDEYQRGFKDAVKKYGDPYWVMDHGDEEWLRDELFDEIILKIPSTPS